MEKARSIGDLALVKAIPNKRVYFEYPVVELAVVLVEADSFFCAQAPKLRAVARTAMIMIAFKNFNVISPSFLAGCSRSLGGDVRRRNAFLDFFGRANKAAVRPES
jgi:hypothetical protein